MIKANVTCLENSKIKWPKTYQVCPRIGDTIFPTSFLKDSGKNVGKVVNVVHGLKVIELLVKLYKS